MERRRRTKGRTRQRWQEEATFKREKLAVPTTFSRVGTWLKNWRKSGHFLAEIWIPGNYVFSSGNGVFFVFYSGNYVLCLWELRYFPLGIMSFSSGNYAFYVWEQCRVFFNAGGSDALFWDVAQPNENPHCLGDFFQRKMPSRRP